PKCRGNSETTEKDKRGEGRLRLPPSEKPPSQRGLPILQVRSNGENILTVIKGKQIRISIFTRKEVRISQTRAIR
ncbi:MAG: hypothetical protein ACREQ3_12365, partial [Candidatus Binatia bacterium]